jgi:hypothetical protein
MLSTHEKYRIVLVPLALVSVFAAGYIGNQASSAAAAPSRAFTAAGIIHSTDGGFQFPDGTIQVSAATNAAASQELIAAVRRLSVNQGLYDNRVPDLTHNRSSVEICFKAGALDFDENDAGIGTAGGDCEPGDVGWIIERDERPESVWTDAKAACLMVGMRLPEVFEYQLTCHNAVVLGIIDMQDDYEWVSNTAQIDTVDLTEVTSAVLGLDGCNQGGGGALARPDGFQNNFNFRCAL